MNSRITFWTGSLLVMILAVSISPAKADTITFDQTNTGLPEGSSFQNIQVFSPIGQSFTPTLASLNFVDLLTATTGSASPFTLEVEIRSGSISGTILGVSQPTMVTPPSATSTIVTPFTFSMPVTLVPSDLYVIQVLAISGDALVGSSGINNYPGGTQILGGIAQPNNDLWFQEGISVPEPGELLMLVTGLIGLLTFAFVKNRWSY